MKLTFGEIKTLFTDHNIDYPDETPVKGICRDSRELKAGEIFVAIKGDNFDGHDFVLSCFEKGAAAAIVECDCPLKHANMIRVDNVVLAIGRLASYYRAKFTRPVIAITGSNGKTTTKEMLISVLGSEGPVIATRGNLNNHIGVPFTIFRFCDEARYFIVEMGMNHPGEIQYLTRILKPDFGLITTVGHAHLEGVGGTLEGVARAKGELFAELTPHHTAFVFADDIHIRGLPTRARRVTYGFTELGQYRAIEENDVGGHSNFIVVHDTHRSHVSLNMVGRHYVQNALAVYTIASELGLKEDIIVKALNGFKMEFNRGRHLQLGKMIVIDDTYNANPDSARASLKSVCDAYPSHFKVAALGAMLELGPDAPALHQQVGCYCRELGFNELLVFGINAEYYLKGFGFNETQAKQRLFESHQALACAITNLVHERNDAVVLLKGSRGMTMEKVLQVLENENIKC